MNQNEIQISRFVLDFYKGYPGNFLEVGSGHPIEKNLTYLLEKNGWSGMCVEPRTNHNDDYKNIRPNSILENYALVSNEYYDEHIKAYINEDYNLYNVTGLNVVNKDDFIFWPVSTLNTLLKKHQIRTIDFFSLDAQGYEHEVLQGIDFHSVRFGMILIELQNYSWNNRTNDFSILRDYGYSYASMITDRHELWINDALPVIKRPIFKSNLL